MRRLNILVLQPDFSRYTSAYYQHDFTEASWGAAIESSDTVLTGTTLVVDGYDRRHSIEDVLRLCPFEPDLGDMLCCRVGS